MAVKGIDALLEEKSIGIKNKRSYQMEKKVKGSGVSADLLKWIAIITMFIDHIGAAVVEKTNLILQPYGIEIYYTLRYIGRLAFPIFCFLLIEGFYHTRSRKNYLRNLLLFSLISEIPFEISFLGELVWGFHNVYFTLAIGMIVMMCLEKVKERALEKQNLWTLLIVAAGSILAEVLHTDYGAIGVLLIYILYKLQDDRKKQCICGAIAMSFEITAPIAFLLMYQYNGVRRQKHWKYFFYAFYPLHLLFLYWIRTLIV